MEEELAAFKQSVQDYETNEAALKSKVLVSEENLKKQQKTFAEAGNPDYDHIMKLEECMRKELVQIGNSIKDSLVKEMQNNNRMMEEKIMSHQQPIEPAKKSNANDAANPWNQAPQAVDFRTILQETQNEQLNEANDQKIRAKNIIIHGVDEDSTADNETSKKNDEDFLKKFLSIVATDNLKYRSLYRLGRPEQTKKDR